MPRKIWNDGQEVIEGDLSQVSSALELELYDRIIYEMLQRQQSVLFGDSLVCSFVNSVTSQVKAGTGFQLDAAQADPEAKNRPLFLAVDTNLTHAAPDGTNNRIDIICVNHARANGATVTRNFKDAGSGLVSAQSMVVETDWASSLSIVTGTPSGSPAVPATPAGKMKLAEILVTAVSGIGSSTAYTDKRPRYKRGASWKKTATKAANYTADLDDEIIFCSSTFNLTFPPASQCNGKLYKVINIGSGVITVLGADSALFLGLATYTLDTQYTAVIFACNGTAWFVM